MSIYLIRHGETVANAERVIQKPDNPLNERGLAQAERLAERLKSERIALILSSDYERAAQTARPIALASGAPLVFDEDLRERHFGDLRGRAYGEIAAEVFAAHFEPPNGETWRQFHERVARMWARVVERALTLDGALVVVTHGLFCRVLIQNHLIVDGDALPPAYGFGNCSVTVIDPELPFRVRLLNCCAHLDGLREAAGAVVGI